MSEASRNVGGHHTSAGHWTGYHNFYHSTMSHLMQAVGAQQQSQNNVWAEEFQTSTGHKVNTNALPHPALASLVTLFRPERL
jgi:hypothetical protein